MPRYRVSLPGFKFTAFEYEDGDRSLDRVKVIPAKGRRKAEEVPGRAVLRTEWDLEAVSLGDAIAKFNEIMGISRTTRIHEVYDLDAREREAAERKAEEEALARAVAAHKE